jgi:hypothetical protein
MIKGQGHICIDVVSHASVRRSRRNDVDIDDRQDQKKRSERRGFFCQNIQCGFLRHKRYEGENYCFFMKCGASIF